MISSNTQTPSYILPIIVISQVAGTSLWFAGNAVMASLQGELGLPLTALGHATCAVQLGFITAVPGLPAAVADSPQFSTLVAQNAPKEATGTALTIVNCLGFSITIYSIQFFNMRDGAIAAEYRFTLLAGPLLGLIALKRGI